MKDKWTSDEIGTVLLIGGGLAATLLSVVVGAKSMARQKRFFQDISAIRAVLEK